MYPNTCFGTDSRYQFRIIEHAGSTHPSADAGSDVYVTPARSPDNAVDPVVHQPCPVAPSLASQETLLAAMPVQSTVPVNSDSVDFDIAALPPLPPTAPSSALGYHSGGTPFTAFPYPGHLPTYQAAPVCAPSVGRHSGDRSISASPVYPFMNTVTVVPRHGYQSRSHLSQSRPLPQIPHNPPPFPQNQVQNRVPFPSTYNPPPAFAQASSRHPVPPPRRDFESLAPPDRIRAVMAQQFGEVPADVREYLDAMPVVEPRFRTDPDPQFRTDTRVPYGNADAYGGVTGPRPDPRLSPPPSHRPYFPQNDRDVQRYAPRGGDIEPPRALITATSDPSVFNMKDYLADFALIVQSGSTTRIGEHELGPVYLAISKCSYPSLPNVPMISQGSDWTGWDKGIRGLLRRSRVLGWILDAEEGKDLPQHLQPTFPIADLSSARACEADRIWHRIDEYIFHIIVSQVSPAFSHTLPDINSGATSRDAYNSIKLCFGSHGYEFGAAQWALAKGMKCGTGFRDVGGYIGRFEKHYREVVASSYPVPASDVIKTLLSTLPKYHFGYIYDDFRRDCDNGRRPRTDDWTTVDNYLKRVRVAFNSMRVDSVGSSSHNGGSSRRMDSSNRGSPLPNLSNTTSSSTSNSSSASKNPSLPPATSSSKPAGARPAAVICYSCNQTGHTQANCHNSGGDRDRSRQGQAFYAGEGGATGEYVPAGGGDIDETDRGVVETVDDNFAVEDGGSLADSVGYMASTLDSLTIRDDVDTYYNDDTTFSCYAAPLDRHPPPPSTELSQPARIDRTTFSIFNSGANQHIFNTLSHFATCTPVSISIGTAGASALVAKCRGVVSFLLKSTTGKTVKLMLADALYCPDCPVNLVSVGRLTDIDGYRLLYGKGRTVMWKTVPRGQKPQDIFLLHRHGHLTACHLSLLSHTVDTRHDIDYVSQAFAIPPSTLDAGPSNAELPQMFKHSKNNLQKWHRRLRHASWETVRAVLTRDIAKGVSHSGSMEASQSHFPITVIVHQRQGI
ncbi:hypothetical protein BKA70DRAFT_1235725 [Coprinopsis sp. MPI-PUGE-AT-0042]|nr:hypothetical protein BKA70DRAFT_1235725 [Coprinopsis sp. MPI-PUGE-AT-0042]